MTLKLRREKGKLKVHRSHMPGGKKFSFKGHPEAKENLEREAKRLETKLRPGKRCSDCSNISESRTSKGRQYYCKEKRIWIPERKYHKKRKCGRFEPLAYTGR